jgi:hypothetical protein
MRQVVICQFAMFQQRVDKRTRDHRGRAMKFNNNLIQGWRPEVSGLTPGYWSFTLAA